MTDMIARPQAPWALRLLPPFPAVAHRILGLVSQSDAGVREVADLIKLDTSFSAQLLRFANSAMFGARREVTSDEGILLESGQRIAEGQRPYVDFFGYMTPGSYWLQAMSFRCFGVSLRAGRLPVILDFALQCALLFWLIASLGSRRIAWATVALFFIFQFVTPGLLTPQHRWDSGALATLSICVCLWGKDRGGWPWLFLGGVAIAMAVLCTPSMAILAVATALWLFVFPNRRRLFRHTLRAEFRLPARLPRT